MAKFCSSCLNELENRKNKFCSDCISFGKHIHMRKENLFECKKDSTRRKFLIKRDGHFCKICFLSEWCCKPIPLELDHIDGNYKNNDESNLRVICPNCHAQTSTYKNRNKGNGRENRRFKRQSPESESNR